MLKRGLSRRERARREETEAAHPTVAATGPGKAREVLPQPVFVSEISVFVCSENLWKSLGNLSVTHAPLTAPVRGEELMLDLDCGHRLPPGTPSMKPSLVPAIEAPSPVLKSASFSDGTLEGTTQQKFVCCGIKN